ncbi:MAG: DUF4446 family protein [Candidatus Pacebacteria bacterium]|nr:DUF4446 family protein [Candidatus Paceibacterota bacterium]
MENTLLYGIVGLGILLIALTVWTYILTKKIKDLSAGKKASSLESIIIENNDLIKKTKRRQKENTEKITHLKSELLKTIRDVSVVRFDALGDSGGKQSFAIGLTDAHKNGVVISSMYTRGSMNVFAKKIIKGTSKHNLTDEEKQVINSN